jgi:hypothetical protein
MDDAVQTAMERQLEKWMNPYQKYLTLEDDFDKVNDEE